MIASHLLSYSDCTTADPPILGRDALMGKRQSSVPWIRAQFPKFPDFQCSSAADRPAGRRVTMITGHRKRSVCVPTKALRVGDYYLNQEKRSSLGRLTHDDG